jgi:hypothetical protein
VERSLPIKRQAVSDVSTGVRSRRLGGSMASRGFGCGLFPDVNYNSCRGSS